MIMEEHDIRFEHDKILLGIMIKRIELWNKEKKALEEEQKRYDEKPGKHYKRHIEIIDRLCKIRNYMPEAFIKVADIFKRYHGHPLAGELLKNTEAYEHQN